MPDPGAMPREPADSPGSHGEAIRPRSLRLALAPILIVGSPRSGTTWLQRMLLGLRACCGGQESHALCTIAKVIADFDRKAAMPRPHGIAAYLGRVELLEAMRAFWVRIVTPAIDAAPAATRLVEKTPDHALHLDLADALLPSCRAIHLVRDPREVVASLLAASRRPWGAGWAPSSAHAAVARWRECVESAEASGARLGPGRVLRVRYEDLRRDPAGSLRGIAEFMGLGEDDLDAGELAAAANAGGAEIPLFGQLAGRRAVEPEGFAGASPPLGAWARRIVQRDAGAWMRELGYGGGRR
jgi:hypothetical protein